MTAYLAALIGGAGLVYLSENNSKTGPFAAAVFVFLAGAIDLAGLNSYAAVAAAAAITGGVYVFSRVKYRMTRFPLFYNDMLEFDPTVFDDLFTHYLKETALALSGIVLFGVAAAFAVGYFSYDIGTLPALAVTLAGAAGVAAFHGRANRSIAAFVHNRAHIAAFFAQMLHQRFRRAKMRQLIVADVPPMPGLDRAPAQVESAPHLVLIYHESTFPPSLYGFPEEADIAAFFAGRYGSRPLVAEVFGGQTIVTSFACQTGLSSMIFGSHRSYAARFWTGRIKVSLPFFLGAHGYDAHAVLPVEDGWMGLGDFYRSIGFNRTLEPQAYAPGAGKLYGARDRIMLDGAAADIAARIGNGAARTYTLIETLGNHGPHDYVKFPDPRVEASKVWFRSECEAKGLKPTAELVEYYGRLRATVDDYSALCSRLERENPGAGFLLVNIGDHQPTLVNGVAPEAPEKHYVTFIAADTIRFEGGSDAARGGGAMPIFNVDLAIAQFAGLPLNGFLAAKADFPWRDAASGFGVDSDAYASLVRGLIRAGLIVDD